MIYDLWFSNERHYLQSEEVNKYIYIYIYMKLIMKRNIKYLCKSGVFLLGWGEGQFNQIGFDSPHYSPRYQIS